MACPFCAIVTGATDAHEVYRDDDVVAFLDHHPAARGHTLVVPTAHREGLFELDGDETATLFRAVRAIGDAIRKGMDADGVSIFQSSGAAAGQDVFHVHVHVVPRYHEDDIRFAPSRLDVNAAEGDAIVDTVRSHLDLDEPA